MTAPMRGERILVTGAGGFIGLHLVSRLQQEGAEVVPLTRATADLTDQDSVRRAVAAAAPDVVLHLAAARRASDAGERAATTAVNAMAGAWVVEAVPDTCRVVVRLGSSTEYAASERPMAETTPLRPRGYFGATKAAGSMLFTATATQRGIRSAVLRAFQVYGPGDKPERFVPTALAAARTGEVLPLTSPGLCRDWVWVEDVVEACLAVVERDQLPDGAVYNIGTGVQTSNEELVALVEQVTRRRVRTRVGAHPGRHWDTGSWVCDPTAAREQLDWKPQADLVEGLSRTWAETAS